MNKNIGLQMVVYSLLLAGFSYLTHHLAPALAKPTLIAGLVGGALCLVWGLRAVTGSRGKALPLLTLIPVNFVMVSQTVTSWWGRSEVMAGRQAAAAVITLLCLLSFGMLIRIAYAGEVFDGQPASAATDGRANSQTTGKPAVLANAAKRA